MLLVHRCMSGMHVCTVYLHVGQYDVCLQVLTCLIQYNVLTYICNLIELLYLHFSLGSCRSYLPMA